MSLLTIVLTPFFIGGAIKKTFDAPKEDKFSTLMEATVGEILPFWLLFSPLMRGMEDGINILQNIPFNKFKGIGGALARAGSGIGKLLAVGLDKGPNLAKLGGFAGPAGFIMGLVRLALFAKLLQPVMEKFFMKASHTLFGKPQATIDEENAIKAEEEKEKAEELARQQAMNGQYQNMPLPVNPNEPVSPFVSKYKDALTQDRQEMGMPVHIKAGGTVSPFISRYKEVIKQDRMANPGQVNPAYPVSDQATPVMPNIYADDDVQPVYSRTLSADTSPVTPISDSVADLQKAAEFNAALAGADRNIMRAEKLLSGS
jgi:hypothetical protein